MYWTYPLEMEQWKKSIFACWGLKNEHTKNPPDIEVKHSTLKHGNLEILQLASLKAIITKLFPVPKNPPWLQNWSQPFVQMMSFCFRWGVMMIFDHVFVAAALPCHMCTCAKKAEAKEKVEQKATLQGLFREGCQLKSAIQNPSLVDPKHSSLFFWWGSVVLNFYRFPGVVLIT